MVTGNGSLQLRGLEFSWPGAPVRCLDVPQLDVQGGERIFLHGPSGSGKSTFLAILGGVLVPDRGEVRLTVDGRSHDLPSLSRAARDRLRVDHVGFIFQQFNLVPYLGVLENVMLPCRFSSRRRERAGLPREEARRLLRALQIADGLLERPVTQLSVGQQQRVAAARALIGRPEFLVADEPTSSLDAQRQDAFIELLLDECAATGATLIFVSHDQRLAHHFTRQI
ncbi:MAG TPA: ABC transporter ATP-binding protein, partial [Ramlibacter sp.]